jgi:post-segregation antitoxin (ccd killing protein)
LIKWGGSMTTEKCKFWLYTLSVKVDEELIDYIKDLKATNINISALLRELLKQHRQENTETKPR